MDTEPRSTSPAKYRGSGFSNTTAAFMAIVKGDPVEDYVLWVRLQVQIFF